MKGTPVSRILKAIAMGFAVGLLHAEPVAAEPASSPPIAQARTVVARGEGASLDLAVRSALRRAVEQAVGVQVTATTTVDRFEVVRNEIVSHAEGYVSRYRVVRQGTADNGATFAEIEAEVDGGRIRDNADAIRSLLAMAGHPRVIVLSFDEGFDAVSGILPEFVALRDAAADILRDRFGFATIDTKAMPRRGAVQGRPQAITAARETKADYVILVALSRASRLGGAELSMEAVKIADGTVIARDSASGTVENRVFPLTVGIASQIAADVQDAAISGRGFRYGLTLSDFPPEDAAQIERQLSGLPGFMRAQTEARDRRSLSLSVWSQQTASEFDAALRKLLAERNVRLRMYGQSFRLDYIDPVFR
jgi:hypothetical protein